MCEEGCRPKETLKDTATTIVIPREAYEIAQEIIENKKLTLPDGISLTTSPVEYFSKLTETNLPPETQSHNENLKLNITEFFKSEYSNGIPWIHTIKNKENYDNSNFEQLINIAANLHDIGKIGVDPKLDEKAWDELTELQQKRYKTHHTKVGVYILAHILESNYPDTQLIQEDSQRNISIDLTRLSPDDYDGIDYATIFKIINNHHKPYTEILYDIPSHIVSVFDVIDALTNQRGYNADFTQDEALSHILFRTGSQFNPAVVHSIFDFLSDQELKRAERKEIGKAPVLLRNMDTTHILIDKMADLNDYINKSNSQYTNITNNDSLIYGEFASVIKNHYMYQVSDYIEDLEIKYYKKTEKIFSKEMKQILFLNILEYHLYNGDLEEIYEENTQYWENEINYKLDNPEKFKKYQADKNKRAYWLLKFMYAEYSEGFTQEDAHLCIDPYEAENFFETTQKET